MNNRTLKKSNNRMIAGVCAGIAEYYGWDPGAVRVIFVLLAVFGASGLIAYLILYFLMPAA